MSFTTAEEKVLSRYFTNTDQSIFALINLPEVIKGTLISRYSRSNKDMRRLFLDEFLQHDELKELLADENEFEGIEDMVKLKRAEDFYERILVGFGDDSVAELGGAHIALEQVSMLAAKEIEEHRIGFSPLEVSSRYVYFDEKVDGQYQYYRDEELMKSEHSGAYVDVMEFLFDSYSRIVHELQPILKEVYPGDKDDVAYRFSIRAKACDIARNLLPTSSYTRMGMFGNGRAFEYLLLNLSRHPLGEMRDLSAAMEENLSFVIPAFLQRLNNTRGDECREYLDSRDEQLFRLTKYSSKKQRHHRKMSVKLIDYDKGAEEKILAAILFTNTNKSFSSCRQEVKKMSSKEKEEIFRDFTKYRKTRHHKPGRELEEPYFSFEVTADWGVYKDLQRHRILTRHKQLFTNNLGYRTPEELKGSPLRKLYSEAQERAGEVYETISKKFPYEAQYLVTHGAYNRFYMRMNLREAVHLTELRSSEQGHPWYREVAQEIARLISEKYPLLGKYAFEFVDYKQYHLERLDAFRRIQEKAKNRGVEVFKES